jgi:hypothetical protein
MNKNNEISKKKVIELMRHFIDVMENESFDFSVVDNIDYFWDIVEDEKLYNPYITPKSEDVSL